MKLEEVLKEVRGILVEGKLEEMDLGKAKDFGRSVVSDFKGRWSKVKVEQGLEIEDATELLTRYRKLIANAVLELETNAVMNDETNADLSDRLVESLVLFVANFAYFLKQTHNKNAEIFKNLDAQARGNTMKESTRYKSLVEGRGEDVFYGSTEERMCFMGVPSLVTRCMRS